MSAIFGFIAIPLGWLMRGCYMLLQNYGVTLIVFTLLTRLIVLPLQIKQQKSSAKMARLQPELKKLQTKYAKNKEKYQEEMMKLYSKENVSPGASCLPMLITFVMLFALIEVIYNPLSYITSINNDDLDRADSMITNLYTVSTEVKNDGTTIEKLIDNIAKDNADASDTDKQTELRKKLNSYSAVEKLSMSETDMDTVMEVIEIHPDIDSFMSNSEYITANLAKSRPELLNFSFVNKADGAYADVLDVITPDGSLKNEIDDFDYTLFGIFLGDFPKWNGFNSGSLLVLIPIISLIAQLLVTFVSQHYMKVTNPAAANMGGGMKVFMYIMPLFSFYIAFNFPAGLGIYWILSSIFALGQTVFLNKVYTPEHVSELIELDKQKKKDSGKKSFMEKAIEMQNDQNGGRTVIDADSSDEDADDEQEDRKLSKSELKDMQRQKLKEARRRMAEKYGEEYNDKED